MKTPVWIPCAILLAAHGAVLSHFGGRGGLRGKVPLESVLARPQQLLMNESPSLFQLAAAYAQGIATKRPFLDGNKRSAFMAAYIFLAANGAELEAPEPEAVLQTLALAAGECSEAEYAAWLERSCKPSP